MGYIDFHTHILPQMDDGSTCAEMSVDMMRMLKRQGVDALVATPHFYPDDTDPNGFLNKRATSAATLLSAVEGLGEDIPEIYLGAEVAYFDGMSASREIKKLCIEGTSVLLLEMPFCAWGKSELREISGLIDGAGITVVIAHVERYFKYIKKGILNELIDVGVIFQCNAGAFLSLKTRGMALKLLNDGCVIGSDCHDIDKRCPNVESAVLVVEKKLGNAAIYDLASRSRKLLAGAERFI